MVQINRFNAPDSLIRPDVQKGGDRDEERVDQLKEAALNQLPVFEAYLDATRAEGVAPHSGFETHERFLVFNTRRRIFDVLRQGGIQYAGGLDVNSEFSRVEASVWGQRRQSTLRSIENRGSSAQASLLVAEGYGQILGTAMTELESDWQKQIAITEEYFANRGFWSKVGGLWRKRRFNIYNKRFSKRLEKRKTHIQQSIERVKGRKERDVKNAELVVKGAFRDANDQQKETLWRAVRNAVSNPNANGAASAGMFGVNVGTDFLEAIKNLGMVESVAQGRRSEELRLDADTKIQNLNDREDIVYQRGPVDYKALQTSLETLVVRPKGDDALLSTDQIAAEIESRLIKKDVNIREDVYGGNDIEGISQAEKMMYFVVYLNNGTNQAVLNGLGADLQRKILKYLLDLDTQTKSGHSEKEGKAFKQADEDLKEVLESGNLLTDVTTGLPKLKDLQDLTGFRHSDKEWAQ